MDNPFKIKVMRVANSAGKQSEDWDGTGKHPTLGMTKAEILAYNEQVTDKYAGTIADSKDKVPQPSFQEEAKNAAMDAQQKQQLFVDNLADNLSTRK